MSALVACRCCLAVWCVWRGHHLTLAGIVLFWPASFDVPFGSPKIATSARNRRNTVRYLSSLRQPHGETGPAIVSSSCAVSKQPQDSIASSFNPKQKYQLYHTLHTRLPSQASQANDHCLTCCLEDCSVAAGLAVAAWSSPGNRLAGWFHSPVRPVQAPPTARACCAPLVGHGTARNLISPSL